MMVARRDNWISPEEYLHIDRASQDIRYEYMNGHNQYEISGDRSLSTI